MSNRPSKSRSTSSASQRVRAASNAGKGSSKWLWIGIVAVVVVVGVVGVIAGRSSSSGGGGGQQTSTGTVVPNGNPSSTSISVQGSALPQMTTDGSADPALGKTATLQVDSFGAQKLALSQQLGVISLALRKVGDANTGSRATVTGRDITASRLYIGERRQPAAARPLPMLANASGSYPAAIAAKPAAKTFSGPSVTVVRGTKTSEVGVINGY